MIVIAAYVNLIPFVIAGSMLYQIEQQDQPELFSSISDVLSDEVTFTTIGYGDVAPVMPLSYLYGDCRRSRHRNGFTPGVNSRHRIHLGSECLGSIMPALWGGYRRIECLSSYTAKAQSRVDNRFYHAR